MAKSEPGSGKKGRLGGFRGLLAAIGALLGGLWAGITQIDEIKGALTSLVEESEVAPVAEFPLSKPERKTCFTIETRHPEAIPLNLFPRLPHLDHFPCWFEVKAENACDEDLTIHLEFVPKKGPITIENSSKTFSDTLRQGDYVRCIDPALTILDYDAGGAMRIEWRVRDDEDTVLRIGNTEIDLLPRSTIAWDLKNVDGEPVPPEYLLASLAAWTATPDPELEKMAGTCSRVDAAATGLESAFQLRECYRQLFLGDRPVTFYRGPLRFPDTGRQTVLPPSEVLEQRHANQLEAAILLAAVGRQLGPSFRLIGRAQPESGGDLKSFLLAVRPSPTASWIAVDLGRPAGTELEENLRAATAEFEGLEQNEPQIFRQLETTGVYLDPAFAAIDFQQANRHYDIGKLPS